MPLQTDRRLGVLLVVAAVIGAAATARGAPATLTGPDVIAFGAAQGRVPHIWLTDAASGARQRLTSGRYGEDSPSWSPGGTRLVFAETRRVRVPGLTEPQLMPVLAIMRLDTGSVRTITSGAALDESPSWSPDGRRIAFTRTALSGGSTVTHSEIWTIGSDGGHPRRLTRSAADEVAPEWAPDGRSIVFARLRRATADLWAMRPDGSRQRLLARDGTAPAWSPGGTRIAFGRPKRAGSRDCCARDLYVMDADGGSRRLLVRDANQPSWSSDGTRIAFTKLGAGRPQIWIVRSDGTGARRLTGFSGGAYGPAWVRRSSPASPT